MVQTRTKYNETFKLRWIRSDKFDTDISLPTLCKQTDIRRLFNYNRLRLLDMCTVHVTN